MKDEINQSDIIQNSQIVAIFQTTDKTAVRHLIPLAESRYSFAINPGLNFLPPYIFSKFYLGFERYFYCYFADSVSQKNSKLFEYIEKIYH